MVSQNTGQSRPVIQSQSYGGHQTPIFVTFIQILPTKYLQLFFFLLGGESKGHTGWLDPVHWFSVTSVTHYLKFQG